MTAIAWQRLKAFLLEEEGPTAVEYAVMLAMILMAAMTAIVLLGDATSASLDDSATKIKNAMNGQ